MNAKPAPPPSFILMSPDYHERFVAENGVSAASGLTVPIRVSKFAPANYCRVFYEETLPAFPLPVAYEPPPTDELVFRAATMPAPKRFPIVIPRIGPEALLEAVYELFDSIGIFDDDALERWEVDGGR